MQYNGYRDLKVYKLAYKLAMEVFEITKSFPKEEKYLLVDQIKRSSRSIPANAWPVKYRGKDVLCLYFV